MTPLALALALATAAAPRVAVSDFTATGVAPEQASFYTLHFLQALAQRDVAAAAAKDTDVAAASHLVAGEVTVEGGEWTVKLDVAEAATKTAVASYATRVKDEEAVLRFLTTSADDVAEKLGPPRPGSGRGWIVAAVAAGVFAATGGVLMGLARGDEQRLRDGAGLDTYADVVALRGRGETLQFTGVVFLAAAGAAAISSLILFGFKRTPSDVAPRFVLLPGGGGWAGLAFRLP